MGDAVEPVIIHEVAGWLVLNKPAGWHSVAARPGRSHERRSKAGAPAVEAVAGRSPDVESWLRDDPRFPWARELDESGLVHRLDLQTSGCLLVAKSAAEQQRLRAAFQRGEGVRKTYLAIVSTSPSPIPDRGEFRLYFTSRHKRSGKITVSRTGEARYEGRCSWRVIERASAQSPPGDLIEVELHGPGRRHQIRAGLAFLGHPIIGDEVYRGQPRPAGLALHAWKLEIDGTQITCPSDCL